MSKFTRVTECADRSYDHFESTLRHALDIGYKIGGFGTLASLRKSEMWMLDRHDIDFSPHHAIRMASIECRLGISSTYFVSLHRPHYNLLTEEMRKKIHSLIELGHEIGLHYEPRFDRIEEEIVMLEYYFDTKITAIARHNPFGVRIDIDRESKPKNVMDAYDPELMREAKYLSDSSGHWREGCFCGHLERRPKIQMLIHPEWWNETTMDPVDILADINRIWRLEGEKQGSIAIDNLKLHREKMFKGLV